MKTVYLVTVDHPKPLPEGFADMAAGRIESMSFIDLVTAEHIEDRRMQELCERCSEEGECVLLGHGCAL